MSDEPAGSTQDEQPYSGAAVSVGFALLLLALFGGLFAVAWLLWMPG